MNDNQQDYQLFQVKQQLVLFQVKQQLAQEIKTKKEEILRDMAMLQRELKDSCNELLEVLDLPSKAGVNTCGINQNQRSLDIKTGELKALMSIYCKM